MGALIFNNLQPAVNMPRSYVLEIVIWSSFATEPDISGRTVSWFSLPGYQYTMTISPKFFPWSSNVYSLDGMWELDSGRINCFLFACFDQVDLGFTKILGDGIMRPWAKTFATASDTRIIPLPSPSSPYWLPGGPL